MDSGQSTPAVGVNLGLSAKARVADRKTVHPMAAWSAHCLMHTALARLQVWDQQEQQRIIAVVCSPPQRAGPLDGCGLLTEEVIKRKLVPRVAERPLEFCSKAMTSSHGGKKCGAWESWMMSISSRWKTCSRYTKSPCQNVSLWFASTKSRWCCIRIRGLRFPCSPDKWHDVTMSTSAAVRPTSFAASSPRLAFHFTKVTPTRASPEFADFIWRSPRTIPPLTPSIWSWTT